MGTIAEKINLDGRRAVVMGGAGHIGSVLAEALAEVGADIVLCDLDEAACQTVADEIASRHARNVTSIAIDLADAEAIQELPAALGQAGGVDIVVNCAAFVGDTQLEGWNGPMELQSAAAWDVALRVNLTAPFLIVQALRELLTDSGCGSVINVGSIYGIVGPDWRLYEGTDMSNPAAYGASKGGLRLLTRWLATTLAPEIRVNSISPGGVFRDTPEPFLSRYIAKTPLGRMATEDDLKGAVVFLASDLSAYVTGHDLVIDGGWTAW